MSGSASERLRYLAEKNCQRIQCETERLIVGIDCGTSWHTGVVSVAVQKSNGLLLEIFQDGGPSILEIASFDPPTPKTPP